MYRERSFWVETTLLSCGNLGMVLWTELMDTSQGFLLQFAFRTVGSPAKRRRSADAGELEGIKLGQQMEPEEVLQSGESLGESVLQLHQRLGALFHLIHILLLLARQQFQTKLH